ncbi:MAG: 30S ribosomal protein S8 [bacterium]|nr:30S ribosomal protein S8 [bacterium]
MYIDLLTKIKNAQQAGKEGLKVVHVKMDASILDILVKSDYLESVIKKGRAPKRVLDIKLKYQDGKGAINGIKFVSKPSRHIYIGYKDLRSIKQGYGLGVISTSKGIMTTKEARKEKLGGEVLFEIW